MDKKDRLVVQNRFKSLLHDDIVKILLKNSHITKIQLETILIDALTQKYLQKNVMEWNIVKIPTSILLSSIILILTLVVPVDRVIRPITFEDSWYLLHNGETIPVTIEDHNYTLHAVDTQNNTP